MAGASEYQQASLIVRNRTEEFRYTQQMSPPEAQVAPHTVMRVGPKQVSQVFTQLAQ